MSFVSNEAGKQAFQRKKRLESHCESILKEQKLFSSPYLIYLGEQCFLRSTYCLPRFSVLQVLQCPVGIDRGATDQHIWPRSHAGNDLMPDKMNLDYSKLLYCEFQKYEAYVTMSRWACVSAWRRKVAC